MIDIYQNMKTALDTEIAGIEIEYEKERDAAWIIRHSYCQRNRYIRRL